MEAGNFKEHLSPSSFVSMLKRCQAAEVYGQKETTEAMLIGSYVDAYFSGTLDNLKSGVNSPLIFTQKGELRSNFKMAEDIIEVIKADDLLYQYVSGGELQKHVSGEIAGVKFEGYIDNYVKGKLISDLKVVKSIREKIWNPELGQKESFVKAYGYIYQLAIYQELIRKETGDLLPCFISAVSKEKGYDKEIIYLPQEELNIALDEIMQLAPHFLEIRQGKAVALRCENCEYCRKTKKLIEPIHLDDL